jgi:hypothetical protein
MRRIACLLLLAALPAAGCGKSSKIVPVSGRVTLDGRPLAEARINFQPQGDALEPGPGSFALTDANGEYTLELVGGGGKGAYVGTHRVFITKSTNQPNPEDDRARAGPNLVPPKYNLQSELTCDVPSGGRTDANFDLVSK